MDKNCKKIKPGWYIPQRVKESFAKFCTDKGSIIQEDCAGALVIWQYLPPNIREHFRLAAKGIIDVGEDALADLKKSLALDSLVEIEARTKVLNEYITQLGKAIETTIEPSQEAETESPSARNAREDEAAAASDTVKKKRTPGRRGSSKAG